MKTFRPLGEIMKFPTCIDNVHESLYRSFHILERVNEMLKRGDSHETIKETIELLKENGKCISRLK